MVGSSPSGELPDSSSAALQMALSPQRSTSSSPPSLVLLTKRPSSARSRYGILGGECVYPLRSPAAASGRGAASAARHLTVPPSHDLVHCPLCAARSVSATAGALRARAEPAGPGCFVRLQLWRRLTACCCPTRHTLRAARHRSPSTTPDKSLGRNTQQHAASVRRSWSLARARGAGRPVGRRRLTGTSRSCQCHAHAPVLQLLQMVYLGAYSRHMKAELLRYSRT